MDPENMSGLIDAVMRRHNLHVTQLRDRIRVYGLRVFPVHVHGIGRFECADCANVFTSPFSWLTIDLILQMVIKKWTMKCRACLRRITPDFDLATMVERACMAFKQERLVRTHRSRARRIFSEPHCSTLCEKCGWGREQCWRAPRYAPPPLLIPPPTPPPSTPEERSRDTSPASSSGNSSTF